VTENDYKELIAFYIKRNFGDHIWVYEEVNVGRTIAGKDRAMDIFLRSKKSPHDALAIRCKYQDKQNLNNEDIINVIQDTINMPMKALIVYMGDGFSEDTLQALRSSQIAAACSPDPDTLDETRDTLELDHLIALHFKWWDIILKGKSPI
jgi:hypothetical protein